MNKVMFEVPHDDTYRSTNFSSGKHIDMRINKQNRSKQRKIETDRATKNDYPCVDTDEVEGLKCFVRKAKEVAKSAIDSWWIEVKAVEMLVKMNHCIKES